VEVFNINENVKKVTTISKSVIGGLAVGRQIADSIDDNLVKKVHVGKGSVVLKSVAPKFSHVHSIVIPLKHNGKKKTIQQGVVELDVMVEVASGKHALYGDGAEGISSEEDPSCMHQLHSICTTLYVSTCQPCVEFFTRPQESLASQADAEEDGTELPTRRQSLHRERFSKRGFVPLQDTN